MDKEEAAAKAEAKAYDEGWGWAHDRLPDEDTWSFIPPIDISMPTEDGPPRVLGVCKGGADISKLSCWGSNIIASDGSIVAPDFI
jgi:hypothetical protein